ncbi:hypothetical protein NZD89_05120 [Alicyclobacillus fastidiosus]|uniref:Uncharacterized protein n=1 Tax=Alicyclobacillus fastidiosus TaxID=392011 RepID=A0ABY6ZIR6_9BACL|nr:hypothetical protein [Alicyclobacillus fastidiosus]WAH42814.1 hypothetical protein NZD89_05120 [Alicyclobacillus fastidiosus]GMA64738.1 hypothetical protein GCM10025859_51780 [Alicyclobacillus fastidiosus]
MQQQGEKLEQQSFELEAVYFSDRERFLIERLREFRTIDVEIAIQERKMRGIGLIHEPRITPKGPEEDYLAYHLPSELTEHQQETKAIIERHVRPEEFRYIYASRARVAKCLSNGETDDPIERAQLRSIGRKLYRGDEDRIELTDTERVADLRLAERAEAEQVYEMLKERKEIISFALEEMKRWYHEWYLILWHKYVMDQHWKEVCRIAARNGVALTDEEYRLARKKALHQFDKWAVGLD